MNKHLLLICLLVSACGRRNAEQLYRDYINNPHNRIIQRMTIGEVTATAKWLPAEYRRLLKGGDETGYHADKDDSYSYFNIKFDKKKGDKPDMSKVLYMDFDMQKDFVFLRGNDSILPAICQKIENGVSGSYEYMVAFENKQLLTAEEGFDLIYNDKVFGIGTIAFVYNQADIKKIPVLKKENIR